MSSNDVTVIGPGWVDNMKLDTLDAALQLNTTSSPQADDPDKLWASTARYADDVGHEVLEFSLATERLVNHVKFKVSKFPHVAYLEYFDVIRKVWAPFYDADHDGDEPCSHTVLECVPAVLPIASLMPPGHHPQHSFSGHWKHHEWNCRPKRCQKMRLRFKRHKKSKAPLDVIGRDVAYSLGLKDLYCGYKVDRKKSLPRPKQIITSFTETDTFATAKDLLGSSISYSIRINRAENILQNPVDLNNPLGTPSTQTLVWMSEPQPYPWAVVNYFLDLRDAQGDAQTLDRFYLDPLTDGANCNLYYSNDEPATSFPGSDNTLPPGLAVINGTISLAPLSSPEVPKDTISFVDIDNTTICFNPSKKWWKGIHVKWKFKHRKDHEDDDFFEDIREHPIYDCGEWRISWTRHGFKFTTKHGDECYSDCDDFDPEDEFKVTVKFDGKKKIKIKIKIRNRDFTAECNLTVPFKDIVIEKHRFGGFLHDESLSGDFVLLNHVLKVDEDPADEILEDFFANTELYCVKPEFEHDDTGQTNNAILRYHPSFVGSDFPAGFKGGGPTRYDDMVWAPIARDYRLTRGFLQFPPTKAKYWKLEFCDLTPQSYEIYVPIKRTIRTYETAMWRASVPKRDLKSVLPKLLPGTAASLGPLAELHAYKDQAYVSVGSGAQPSITGTSNTMARIITDEVAQQVLGSKSWAWNFKPKHKMTNIPVFDTKQVHSYSTIDVAQTTKIAYFVGLKAVQPFRVDYLSADDTQQYIEMFHDDTNLSEDSGWVHEADHSLTSGVGQFAQVQSKVLPSNRVVRAIQFATTQSEPFQLLPDDDFSDPQHLHWTSVGDGSLAATTQVQLAIGSTLQIDRSSRVFYFDDLTTTYTDWGSIEASGLTYGALEGAGNPGQALGGVESQAVSVPPGGRLYAAARVVAPEALSSPLFVQIVDAHTGVVVSEESVDVPPHQVTEWHTAMTLSDAATVQAWRWSDFSSAVTYTTISDNFSRVDAAGLGTTVTGELWQNLGTGHTITSLAAKTTTAGAFDYVDGGTPWGTLSFTVGAMAGTGQPYAQLIDFRPISMDDQGIVKYRGLASASLPSASVVGRALLANDTVRIDILPTALVPSAHRDTTYPDNVSAPYSLVFWLNGTWIKTVAHRLGALTRRGILGRLNQIFRNFTWAPANLGALPGPTIVRLPVPSSGSFSADRFTWVDNDSFTWTVTGSWDNTTVAETLVATANGSKMIVDTQYWYGTLSAFVDHVATGTSGFTTPHGKVLALDDANGIYLIANGTVSDGTTNFGTLIPGGVSANSYVQVSFLDTASVDVSVRGLISPTAYPRMLVARVNGAVVGTLATAALQTWTGTRRGLCGDVYNTNGGALPATPIDQLHTSFTDFCWAPDASVVYVHPTSPSWDEVTQRGTATYDSVVHGLTLTPSSYKARVVQKAPSIDTWYMDTLSMYADPIVWSFSNDGGQRFYNVFDTRNNPEGVFVFPDAQIVGNVNVANNAVAFGQALVWRAVAYAPHCRLSSVTIRPWYGGLLSGITHRVGIANGGPNVMPYDDYPPIEQDARFQIWHDPIPQSWYYKYRIINRTGDVAAKPLPTYLVGDSLNSTYGEGQQ